LFFGALALEDIVGVVFFATVAPVLNEVVLEVAGDGPAALHVHGAALFLRTARPQLVVVDLLNAGQHLTRLIHLFLVSSHLVDLDLPIAFIAALISVHLRTWWQHFIAQQQRANFESVIALAIPDIDMVVK